MYKKGEVMFHIIDYTRLLQPQEDGYDISVFSQIKKEKGYVNVEYPDLMRKFNGQVAVVPKNEQNWQYVQQINFDKITKTCETIWPLGYNNFCQLVDAYIPWIEEETNYSGQHDGEEFGHQGGWGIMSSLIHNDPAALFANLMHELMHWKLVALGFGNKANVFFPTTQEFILNHESELCWSIVNSYADTAQPAVGNKPTNRPVSASLHAYLSFLAVANVHVRNLQIDPNNEESRIKARRWASRFDKCLDELWKVGKFTDKGTRLMMGVSKWTGDFFYEAKQVKHLL
jgi:hypothetical protein